MTAPTKIHLRKNARIRILSSFSLLFIGGCATGLKCASTDRILSTLKLPAKKAAPSEHYIGPDKHEATEIVYDNPEYLEIPMEGATCRILIEAGKAVKATGCKESLIGTFDVYRNSCDFW